MKQDLVREIKIIDEINTKVDFDKLIVEGPKGSVEREIPVRVEIKIEKNKLIVTSKRATKREKKNMFTFVAHVKNMLRGVKEPFIYKLKICSGHFPMNVKLNGRKFSIKNFLGEKIPRVCNLPEGAVVKISGNEISVESINIERAGTAASLIEGLTRVSNRDRRIFQDGIFIYEKYGKQLV